MAQLRWFREAANTLLPAGALVGQAAAARLLTGEALRQIWPARQQPWI